MTALATFDGAHDGFLIEKIVPGFQSPTPPDARPDAETLRQAELTSRAWVSPAKGALAPEISRLRPGAARHVLRHVQPLSSRGHRLA